MPFCLKKKNYQVFASIYKIEKGDRHDLPWKDFVRSMNALEFDYCKATGSKRAFRSRRPMFTHVFRWHEPHDGILAAHLQDHMAHKLARTFAWTAASFKLKD